MGAALAIGGIFSFIVVMAIAMEAVFHGEDENPKTLPPNSNIAASKLNLVLVLGSKNNVAIFFPSHFLEYFSLLFKLNLY